jgi:alpha-1,3-mannosyl-glycoprotein beta-1,2-N-acetylglucosaminyltransferase
VLVFSLLPIPCCRRDGGPPGCKDADCYISQHYKLLLQLFLDCHKSPGILFLENDLEVAVDFFPYFEATTSLMRNDSSIYCVSAWNDHGQRGRAKDNKAVYRTDVMPGLGWYTTAAIGLELVKKWPLASFDDWMRKVDVKQNRSCIYPEVS